MTLIFNNSPFRNQQDSLSDLFDRFGGAQQSSSDPLAARRQRRRDEFINTYADSPDRFPISSMIANSGRRAAVSRQASPFSNAVRPAAAEQPFDLNSVVGGDEYLERLAQVESSGNPNARASTSSATGLFQFIDSTALQYQDRLGLGHLSREQFLAMRTDPAVATRMARLFTDDNRRILEQNNLPTDSGALYLAHFAGAGTAARVLRAPRNTPISSVLTPAAIRANSGITFRGRSFAEFTAGDLADWARHKFRRT